MNNGNTPASPVEIKPRDRALAQTGAMGMECYSKVYSGMTKRETIAMHLYAGMLSATDQAGTWTGLDCASDAVEEADKLLDALNK